LELKDSVVQTRTKKNTLIVDLIDATNSFKSKEHKDADEILAQREQI
jgi:hypothetical protein